MSEELGGPALEALSGKAQQRLEMTAAAEVAERYGLELVNVDDLRVDNDLFRSVPMDLMLRYGFVPEGEFDGRLSLVMADPTDVGKLDELELLLGRPVDIKIGSRSAISQQAFGVQQFDTVIVEVA